MYEKMKACMCECENSYVCVCIMYTNMCIMCMGVFCMQIGMHNI